MTQPFPARCSSVYPQRPYPVCPAGARRRRGQILGWQWNGRGHLRHGYLESWQSQLESQWRRRQRSLQHALEQRGARQCDLRRYGRHKSEEHTSELQSLMRISYAVFCLKKKKNKKTINIHAQQHKKQTTKHAIQQTNCKLLEHILTFIHTLS